MRLCRRKEQHLKQVIEGIKREKNDATDAEAICEAVTRANMRFVATKTPEQQSGLMLHRTRHLFIRQRQSLLRSQQEPAGDKKL